MRFSATVGALLFYFVFLAIGLFAIGMGVKMIVNGAPATPKGLLALPILFGSIFAAVGGGLLRAGTKTIVFDRMKNIYWKGRGTPPDVVTPATPNACDLSRIHALQIISEYCRGNKSSYFSYELNVILDDASRMNVVDHGNYKALTEDAQKLTLWLGKPLWDAVASRSTPRFPSTTPGT
jgi:hypothetical protein